VTTAAPRRPAVAGILLALAGAAVASYLTVVKLAGELPVCGPLRGCETVATSSYSELGGVPTAAFGVGLSLLLAGAQLLWWRRGDRRGLMAAYGVGLAGVVVVAYLTYLELFVIGAVCAWCVAYAITIVGGWIVAALALREH
jgi:uncharacterized membrane protein